MSIRLEDCTPDQRRLLLALVALDKAPSTKREADAPTPTSLGDDREFTTSPRLQAA